MSKGKQAYIDPRVRQLQNCNAIIQHAMQSLNAEQAQDSCGKAEIFKSNLDVSSAASDYQKARFQDTVEIADTNDLQARINEDAPDYTAAILGDWQPEIGVGGVPEQIEYVTQDDPNAEGTQLVDVLYSEDLGTKIFFFSDEDGNTSMGLGVEFFDQETGKPKDEEKFDKWNKFAAEAAELSTVDPNELDPAATSVNLKALRAAGLTETRRKKTVAGSTAATWSSKKKTDKAPPKRFGAKKD